MRVETILGVSDPPPSTTVFQAARFVPRRAAVSVFDLQTGRTPAIQNWKCSGPDSQDFIQRSS